jgi:hypothetical protein
LGRCYEDIQKLNFHIQACADDLVQLGAAFKESRDTAAQTWGRQLGGSLQQQCIMHAAYVLACLLCPLYGKVDGVAYFRDVSRAVWKLAKQLALHVGGQAAVDYITELAAAAWSDGLLFHIARLW